MSGTVHDQKPLIPSHSCCVKCHAVNTHANSELLNRMMIPRWLALNFDLFFPRDSINDCAECVGRQTLMDAGYVSRALFSALGQWLKSISPHVTRLKRILKIRTMEPSPHKYIPFERKRTERGVMNGM
ncbi:hypothetical protein Agabi119p4_7826 [Agaricus bisporus var. burnettii]|uniref:Uncharacterized protein n=1 Tax=Agaricus bisporus var. burnettii TaxID=192524 RepID=A0A8H7C8U2_AGABI|nr:hypothetical protein Agabi119p4_7826 [Agaricus bisporus var. burnettii]